MRTTRRQREILRDQAAGIEQRITGQRLGIGLRTVSDEIAAL
ncbi:helix-turn-helix transcriptional regulator, partial [Streptomyces sp. SHP22-7]